MKKKTSARSMPASQELLYGMNPLLEALRAGDRIPTEIVLAEGARRAAARANRIGALEKRDRQARSTNYYRSRGREY